MIQTAPANDDINQIGSAYGYRYLMALFLLITFGMVILTASVEIWSARRQGSDKLASQLVNPFFWLVCLFLIVKSILIVIFIYGLPAYIIVALIKTQIGGESISTTNFVPAFADPMFKLAFMIGLTDNFAETLRYKEKHSFTMDCLQYLFFLPICYYGGMGVAWILLRCLPAGAGLAPSNVEAAGNLFSLPLFVHDVTQNWVIIVVLILIGGALFHWVIESRRE